MPIRAIYILLAYFLLAGFHLTAAEQKPPTEVRDQIVVQVACPKAEAIERTLAAFVREGLHVAKSEGGIVTAVPIPVTLTQGMFKGMFIGAITYSATIIGLSDKGSEVVLGATMKGQESGQITVIRSDMSYLWRKEKDRTKYAPIYAPFWQRLERMAGRLEGVQQPPEEKQSESK